MPISGARWTVCLTCNKAAPKYFYRKKCHVQSDTLVKRCWPSSSLSHLTHPSLAADDQLGLYHSSHFYKSPRCYKDSCHVLPHHLQPPFSKQDAPPAFFSPSVFDYHDVAPKSWERLRINSRVTSSHDTLKWS